MADEFDRIAVPDNVADEISEAAARLAALEKRDTEGNPESDLDGEPEIRTGMFVCGEGDPHSEGDPLTGIAIAYPPITVGGEDWNLVGMEAGALQVGIRASDGKFLAGGGAVTLDADGVSVQQGLDGSNQIKFVDSTNLLSYLIGLFGSGENYIGIYATQQAASNSEIHLFSNAPSGKKATVRLEAQQLGTPPKIYEADLNTTRSVLNSQSADVDTDINGVNRPALAVDASRDTVGIARLNLLDGGALTISGGAITVSHSRHRVDTEGAAATDDLTTINGGVDGDILVLSSVDGTRDTTLKDGTGNMRLAGDFTLSSAQDTITLLYSGSVWLELSRSDNA